MITEGKVRKAYELMNKRWLYADVVERLDLNWKQVELIEKARLRGIAAWKLVKVLEDIVEEMTVEDIEELLNKIIS